METCPQAITRQNNGLGLLSIHMLHPNTRLCRLREFASARLVRESHSNSFTTEPQQSRVHDGQTLHFERFTPLQFPHFGIHHVLACDETWPHFQPHFFMMAA